jgi:hypothetical protein
MEAAGFSGRMLRLLHIALSNHAATFFAGLTCRLSPGGAVDTSAKVYRTAYIGRGAASREKSRACVR